MKICKHLHRHLSAMKQNINKKLKHMQLIYIINFLDILIDGRDYSTHGDKGKCVQYFSLNT
jgi:hypothetical protein